MIPNFSPSAFAFSSYAATVTPPLIQGQDTSISGPTHLLQPRPRGSYPSKGHACKYFPVGWLLPVALELRFGPSINFGSGAGAALNQPTQLLHAQDADFAGCWFSNAIDLGDDSRTPPFWMLRKTAKDTWLLRLCRGKGELAAYRAKTKIRQRFPLKLRKIRSNGAFKDWPSTITINE